MSVVSSKRGEPKLGVITKTRELASYTIKICSNEKNFPKRYRWAITNKIVECSINICTLTDKANSTYVKTKGDYQLRRKYQVAAINETYSLLTLMDIAYITFGVDSKRIDHWTGMVLDSQALLRKWRDSDDKRFLKK